ncbi:MAG: bifunctional adenosylcobinamide kinase/adenosylcobinamide-phosphate guanylyltransferase [Ornithinimicrobium sp.]|uniref:bifunctional adenosylcobinamide kinase/adenosylcobinamide-phosphate guanylyltransferase n=1 Tax=Ornithinimicrobium sp. TaxID=1977084 RepID=UPI0026E0A050|nr:bifunctional adenosylcobinamide kinase/adenosylcobinamide-phosphate guanylyltransferase [Ornithinimicrobium sp.]MDO5740295.1 bifunctional adenosylcobinamide kinase/adenosylcobinamide-phosphate guanylyltransferase [Ornithinimicrobium sp.]
MSLTLLTGGARSGKSSIAVRRAGRLAAPVVFVATGQAGDAEMADRIAQHQAERPGHWTTVEAPTELAAAAAALSPGLSVVIDCLSLWVSNLMGRGDDEAAVLEQAHELGRWARSYPGTVLVVTNEVGAGIVPMHPVSRDYRDRLGRVNAIVAGYAELAQLVVAGRTLTLDPLED